jgi:hypothetical protein
MKIYRRIKPPPYNLGPVTAWTVAVIVAVIAIGLIYNPG